MVDAKLASIMSNFCLDIAKAYFIATFVTPSLTSVSTGWEFVWILLRGLLNVILFLLASWQLAKLGDQL